MSRALKSSQRGEQRDHEAKKVNAASSLLKVFTRYHEAAVSTDHQPHLVFLVIAKWITLYAEYMFHRDWSSGGPSGTG